MEHTRHTLEMFKGAFAGVFGFSIQLTSVDTAVKVGVGVLTVFYLGLKCAEIVRDWKCTGVSKCEKCSHKPTTKD